MKNNYRNEYVMLGNGGHSKVCKQSAILMGYSYKGYVLSSTHIREALDGDSEFLGDDDWLLNTEIKKPLLVNGIGHNPGIESRKIKFNEFTNAGFEFLSIIHPSAYICNTSNLNIGSQVMAGAIIQAGCSIGTNTIINTSASIDHECAIGDHAHIGPGSVLCGNVKIGNGTFIGAGSVIIPGISIGSDCIIGAGTKVLKDIDDNQTFFNKYIKKI